MKASTKDKIIFVGGSKRSFRCDCGCNVFRQIGQSKYRCNACRTVWRGEGESRGGQR